MNVLISGGKKTKNIVDGIDKRLAGMGVTCLIEENIETIKDIYSRGDYFDRCIVIEQSWTHDGQLDDLEEIKDTLRAFLANCIEHHTTGRTYVFVTYNEEMAYTIYSEAGPILDNVAVLLKDDTKFTLSFASELVLNDVHSFSDFLLYTPSASLGEEEEMANESEWGEPSTNSIDETPVAAGSLTEAWDDETDDSGVAGDADEWETMGTTEDWEAGDPEQGWETGDTAQDWETGDQSSQSVSDWETAKDIDTEQGWETTERGIGWGETTTGAEKAITEPEYSAPDQAYTPPDQAYVPQEQAYTPPDQAYNTPDQAYTAPDQAYTPPAQAYVPQDQEYTPQDQAYAPQDQAYVPQEQAYVPQEQAYTPQDQAYTPQDQAYTPQDQAYSQTPYQQPQGQVYAPAMPMPAMGIPNQPMQPPQAYQQPYNNSQDSLNSIPVNDNPYNEQDAYSTEDESAYEIDNNQAGVNRATTQIKDSDIASSFAAFANRGNSILVTGVGGQGTSTVAFNLANTIKNLGYTVLLVDFDTNNRAQSYISKDNFDCLDFDSNNLAIAVNSSQGINAFLSVAEVNLHLLTVGLGEDQKPIEQTLRSEKLLRFANNAKASHNFVIYDIPFTTATDYLSDVTTMADDIVITVDASTWGATKTFLGMCNIGEEDLQEVMFNKGQILFNRYRNIPKILSRKIKAPHDILAAMDKQVNDITKSDTGFYFSKMNICGVIPENIGFESGWMARNHISNTPEGQQMFIQILKNIVLKGV